MRIRHLLPALGLLASACIRASTPNQPPPPFEPATASICPEYRNLGCMTAPQCQLDRSRGCQICMCSPAGVTPQESPRTGHPLGTPTNPTPSAPRQPGGQAP